MLVDTHCHLDAAEFDADRDEVHARALACGVGAIVVPSVERANFAAVASVCRSYAGCFPAYGIHPMYVDRARPDDLDALRTLILQAGPIAVGEIGLDAFAEPRDDALQRHYFAAQLRLAQEAALPVLLHVRRAIDTVLAQLRRTPVVGGIAHAFNGSRQQADEFIKLGFKLGFGGTLTYSRSTRIRALAAELPLCAIVLETDAPDIAPSWLTEQGRSGRNAPGELPRIAHELAALRGMPVDELITHTWANVQTVLPRLALPSPHGQH
jgi:TatD DNase family protein